MLVLVGPKSRVSILRHLAGSVIEHVTLYLRVMSLNPMLGVEIT